MTSCLTIGKAWGHTEPTTHLIMLEGVKPWLHLAHNQNNLPGFMLKLKIAKSYHYGTQLRLLEIDLHARCVRTVKCVLIKVYKKSQKCKFLPRVEDLF